jgi:hypothetical protein
VDESLMSSVRILSAVWLFVASIVCSIMAVGQRLPVRRRQLWLAAALYFGSVFLVVGGVNYLEDKSRNLFEADGVIVVAIVNDEGTTEIQVRMAGGGIAHINALGQSQFFRVGEHIKAKYAGYTGEIQEAQFFAADGTTEGVFHAAESNRWFPYVIAAPGLIIIGLGGLLYWRTQQRLLPG